MGNKSEGHRRTQKELLGEFIKSQRKLAQLSLRDLAERTNISNPYLSQIERGLHEPSIRILRSIAKALNLSLGSLIVQFGLAEDTSESPSEDTHNKVETAIYSDNNLSQYQKEVLIATYRHFTQASQNTTHKSFTKPKRHPLAN